MEGPKVTRHEQAFWPWAKQDISYLFFKEECSPPVRVFMMLYLGNIWAKNPHQISPEAGGSGREGVQHKQKVFKSLQERNSRIIWLAPEKKNRTTKKVRF